MKFLIAFALIAVATALPHKRILSSQIDEIISAINSPSTNPATAAALEQMLLDMLGNENIVVGPALVDESHPIITEPALVEGNQPINIGPALVDETEAINTEPALVEENHPINIGPALVEETEAINTDPALVEQPSIIPSNFKGPLVQVIVNVQSSSNVNSPQQPDVVPDNINNVADEIVPDNVNVVESEIIPDNVNVVDSEIIPDNVVIVDNNKPELNPDNAVNLPEDLH